MNYLKKKDVNITIKIISIEYLRMRWNEHNIEQYISYCRCHKTNRNNIIIMEGIDTKD